MSFALALTTPAAALVARPYKTPKKNASKRFHVGVRAMAAEGSDGDDAAVGSDQREYFEMKMLQVRCAGGAGGK